jgi:hypothetical protein
MKLHPACRLACLIGLLASPSPAAAQSALIRDLLYDLRFVEREEAAAKAIRLKWISEERTRIREELTKYEDELTELRKSVPDPIKPRVVPPAVAKAQERAQTNFNLWAATNDPLRNVAIMKGTGLNALIRILGPIAHCRRQRGDASQSRAPFPSLSPGAMLTTSDVAHLRLTPATSAGSRVAVRLNQLPLEIQWSPIMSQYWKSDCNNINKVRDAFTDQLAFATSGNHVHVDSGELLDKSIELLQAKVLQKKKMVTKDPTLTIAKRTQIHRELQEAVRYLETVRATAERFKNVPSDYKVRTFAGGSIEDFIDFCYIHGMVFQEGRRDDEEAYMNVFHRMQDYAHDVQYVEDWKSDVEQRIRELDAQDQALVWRASRQ